MDMTRKLPEGFSIGHSNDDYTGVTVILCPRETICGVDVRGGAPGTHETDCLRNEKMMRQVNAVALCGGSAYGLGAIAGVMEYLREQKIGYAVADKIVPIVPGAVIYDLNDKDYHYPTAKFGYDAAKSARSDDLRQGKIGVGTGATVGKILGPAGACSSGLGIATVKAGNATVTAVVCVNALGDIIAPDSGNILAGAKDENGKFVGTEKFILDHAADLSPVSGANTTIGCVLTDAKIDKVQANKIASYAHNGLAKTISPVHTDFDGDTLFCLSSRSTEADFLAVQIAAEKAVSLAVVNAVLQ
ncbi:MAG: P1 family peptidase [Clostridia bacterium]|nr:P1 family peptidase [Clostridia bacterium]